MVKKQTLVMGFLVICLLIFQGCTDEPRYEFRGEIFRDNFSSEILGSHWIVGPGPKQSLDDKWSLTANPGHLTILTQPADIYQKTNQPINFFVLEVPYENFAVTTHLSTKQGANLEEAGLMLYSDWDNYARLARVHIGKPAVKAGLETNAIYTEATRNIGTRTEIYLRMIKAGGQISYHYSLDATAGWTKIGDTPVVDWGKTSAVLYGISPVSGSEVEALFDYIEIQELQLIEE